VCLEETIRLFLYMGAITFKVKIVIMGCVRHRPEQNRVTWETPSSESFPLLQEPVGVLASYVTHVQMQV
jgi:hypothetical protein